MKTDVMTIKHQQPNRFKKMLQIVSTLFGGLPEKEQDIICALHRKGGELTTIVRKEIRSELDISEDYLNNYIKKLRNKKVLIEDTLNPNINFKITSDKQQTLAFVFEEYE